MTDYGVTLTGFVKKPLDVILSEIQADERALIKTQINTQDTALVGQLNGIFADKIRECWDVLEAVYRSRDPASASGDALEQVGSITGAKKISAKSSSVVLDRLYLDAHKTIPAGSRVSIGVDGEQFETLLDTINNTDYPTTVSVAAESVNDGPIQGLSGMIYTIGTWFDMFGVGSVCF